MRNLINKKYRNFHTQKSDYNIRRCFVDFGVNPCCNYLKNKIVKYFSNFQHGQHVNSNKVKDSMDLFQNFSIKEAPTESRSIWFILGQNFLIFAEISAKLSKQLTLEFSTWLQGPFPSKKANIPDLGKASVHPDPKFDTKIKYKHQLRQKISKASLIF